MSGASEERDEGAGSRHTQPPNQGSSPLRQILARARAWLTRRYRLLAAWGVASLGWALLQLGPTLSPGWLRRLPEYLAHLRNFGYGDQLSYLAIAANATNGLPVFAEPFTATGELYYPSGYYLGLGLFSKLFGLAPVMAWNVAGLALSLGLVVIIGRFAYSILKRPWAPLLGLAPFLIGTLSTARYGNWLVGFEGHSVVWAPFVALYTLNGEVAAFVVGSIGIMLIIKSMLADKDRVPTGRAAIAGYVIVGLTANMHAYAFITLTAIAVFLFALAWLRAHAERASWLTSAVLLALMFPLGVVLGSATSAAATIAILALPIVPGFTLAWRRSRTDAIAPFAALLLAAAPQLLRTASAIVTSDPYLAIRESINADLAIPFAAGLLLNLPALLLMAYVSLPTARDNRLLLVGQTVAWTLGISWGLLAFNGYWGLNQEPYRFSINGILMMTVLLPAFAIARLVAAPAPTVTKRRLTVSVGWVLVVALTLGLADGPAFWSDARSQSLVAKPSREVFDQLDPWLEGQLTLLEPCIDPYIFKVESRQRIAWYVAAIALPERQDELDTVLASRRQSVFDSADAAEAGITRVVTRQGCDWEQTLGSDPSIELIGTTGSDDSRFSAWSVSPP